MFSYLSTVNTKTLRSKDAGFLTYNLNLAPASLSAVMNTCPKSTIGCRAACLNTAGRGGWFQEGETLEGNHNNVQIGRKRKTHALFFNQKQFMTDLATDIAIAIRKAKHLGMTPCFRLNNTSDLSWELIPVTFGKETYVNIFAAFPTVQFYDYTKVPRRKVADISNYHLTFSIADNNELDVDWALGVRMNVAVVFRKKIPAVYNGLPVHNGDHNDLRFLDPSYRTTGQIHVVGLTAKGRAKKDTTGFVVD